MYVFPSFHNDAKTLQNYYTHTHTIFSEENVMIKFMNWKLKAFPKYVILLISS